MYWLDGDRQIYIEELLEPINNTLFPFSSMSENIARYHEQSIQAIKKKDEL